MQYALIIHPTAAYRTRSGKPKAKAIKAPPAPKGPSREDLKLMCEQRGMRVYSRHTKAELLAMFISGEQSRPAAQDKLNEKRRKKAA